ncbi:MAG: DUF3048 domain-containing protein [Candidatus Dormibacteria bacterium]
MRPTPLLAASLLLVSACGSAPVGSLRPAPTHSPRPTALPTPTPIPLLNAPAIVQVENSPEGRPQSGLGQADVVYEYVAEGGIGRFSLFFFHLTTPSQRVGPVRSARTVTAQLLTLYQGLLAYSGSDAYVAGLLRATAQPAYDEDSASGNLFRINSRSAPHNLYTNESDIAALEAAAALPPVHYRLWPRTTTVAPGGTPVAGFTADISSSEQPHFTWSAALGGFTRTEDTGLVTDPATGTPLALPTVVVQQVAVTTDPHVVDVLGHYGVDQHISGTGTAQVFTAGEEYSATWNQPASGPPAFTLASGAPAPMSPGEVWICLVPIGSPAAAG